MNSILDTLSISKLRKTRAGFTMIELLIVITILGILATAVLSAINPVEQINRGRDTGTRSDAEQLISAIDRYNAFKGYFPWMDGASDTQTGLSDVPTDGSGDPVDISSTLPLDHAAPDAGTTQCHFLNKLSIYNAVGTACDNDQGTEELKVTFIDRITDASYRGLVIYNSGDTGASTYVCFIPQSKAFKTDAKTRCGVAGAGLPADLSDVAGFLCDDAANSGSGQYYTCLP